MREIVICASPHPFGAIQSPAEMMADGLRENGVDVTVFLVSKEAGAKEFVKYIKSHNVDAVIALNPAVLRIRIGFQRILAHIRANLCVFMLDDPSYHLRAIEYVANKYKSESLLFMLPEFRQKVELDKYILNRGYKGVGAIYFPWAGPQLGSINPGKVISYDCAVFCTLDQQIVQGVKLKDFTAEIEKTYNNKNAHSMLQTMLVQDYKKPVSDFMLELTGVKFSLNDESSVALWKRLDSLLKEGRRLSLAKQLIAMAEQFKIKLIICGTGWDKLGELPDSIKLIGAAHYDKQFDFFNESRFLINLDPNWVHGVHDRVFNAMSVGCGVITNENELLDNSFESGVSVLTFTNINQLPTLLLEHDSAKIALCASPTYVREHSWSERVKLLLEYLK